MAISISSLDVSVFLVGGPGGSLECVAALVLGLEDVANGKEQDNVCDIGSLVYV